MLATHPAADLIPMKHILPCLAALLSLLSSAFGQTPAEQELIATQQQIDDAIVAADIPRLQDAYTEDFYFKHGTGAVDDKTSWLKSVEKNRGNFLARQHSNVQVDLHGDIGVTHGNLRVTRKDQNGYLLDYVRVYRRQDGRWQLLSHRTTHEERFKTDETAAPRINHVAFYVVDLKTSTDFYSNVIGLPTIPEPFHDGRHTWYSIGPKTHLHIISGAAEKLPKIKNAHLCFTVPSVEAFVTRLAAAGIAYENLAGTKGAVTERADGVKQIYFQDPDGYWLEINDAKE
jgi:lactoylglutathione lyase